MINNKQRGRAIAMLSPIQSARPDSTQLNSTEKLKIAQFFCQLATFWTFSELVELSWVGRSELSFKAFQFSDLHDPETDDFHNKLELA